MNRVLRSDPITKTSTVFHEVEEGKFTIETVQDVEPTAVSNRLKRNYFDERAGWKGDMHHVASIPNVVLWDLQRKGILDDEKALARWLNDPDNRWCRTRPGRV